MAVHVQIIVRAGVKTAARDVLVVGVAVQTHVKAVARVRVAVTVVEIVLLAAMAVAVADVRVVAMAVAIAAMDVRDVRVPRHLALIVADQDARLPAPVPVVPVPGVAESVQCININKIVLQEEIL